jgi:hypothetical protein
MATTSRPALSISRRFVPVAVSAVLVSWLLWRVSPQALANAASVLDWPSLAGLTAALVLALFVLDTACLCWLFSEPGRPLLIREALEARGLSYLFSAFNYELGQGVLAWRLAKSHGMHLAAALGRCVLLGYHDIVVLLGLGLVGSLVSDDPRAAVTLGFCAGGLAMLLGLAIGFCLTPTRWRQHLVAFRWSAWLQAWTWKQSAQLAGLRVCYYAPILIYVVVGLSLCRVALDVRLVCGTVPLVLLADGLPISISGLGTRETALVYLLDPPQPAVLLAFSLLWSTGLIVGRLVIGLVTWVTLWRRGSPEASGRASSEGV